MKNKKCLIITVLFLIFAFIGCGCSLKSNKAVQPGNVVTEGIDSRIEGFVSNNPTILNDIEILEVKDCDKYSMPYACITLKNKSDKKLNNVVVVIDLIDNVGNILNDNIDTLKSFNPKTEHTFEIPASGENVVSWVLLNINAE